MSTLDTLKAEGPMTARELARRLRLSLVAVYLELVRAEGQGLAQVHAEKPRAAPRRMVWEAL